MDNLVAAGCVLAGFAMVVGFFLKLDKATALVGNELSKLTGRAQKMLSDYRGKTMQNRSRVWKQGGLFSEKTAFGSAMNNVGVRFGSAQARNASAGRGGIKAFFDNNAVTKYEEVVQGQREDDALMKALGNDDDAVAALGGSRGESYEELLAGAHLAGMTGERAEAAARRASSVGAGWSNRMAAFRLTMKNKARAVTPGNVEYMATAARQLSRGNAGSERRIAQDGAFWARSSGRADLGGTVFDGRGENSMVNGRIDMSQHYKGENETFRNARNVYQTAISRGDGVEKANRRAWQVVADANIEDGFTRLPPGGITGSHDNTIIQASETFARILAPGSNATDLQRMHAAMGLKEIHSSRMGMSGTARDAFNTTMDSLGVNFAESMDDELVRIANIPGLTGEQLSRQARAYRDISYGAQMVPGPDGNPIPVGPPISPRQGNQRTGGAPPQPAVPPTITWSPGAPVVVNPGQGTPQPQTVAPNTQTQAPSTQLWTPGAPAPGQQPAVWLPTGSSTYAQFQPTAPPQVGGNTPQPSSRLRIVQAQRIEPGQTAPRPNAAGQGGASNREGRSTYPSTMPNPDPQGQVRGSGVVNTVRAPEPGEVPDIRPWTQQQAKDADRYKNLPPP